MPKLHYSGSIRPKIRLLNKIIKSPQKYSDKFKKKLIDSYSKDTFEKINQLDEKCVCVESEELCELFDTLNMGKGIRAKCDLKAGTRIGCYLGNLIPNKEVSLGNKYIYQYFLKNYCIDGMENNGLMSYLNHMRNPNVGEVWRLHMVDGNGELHLEFYLKKDVAKGKELFIDYGSDYWKLDPWKEDKKQTFITDFFKKSD